MDGCIAIAKAEIRVRQRFSKSLAKGGYQVEAFKRVESFMAPTIQI